MMAEATFQYLNLNNQWPAFTLDGLVNDAGALQLMQTPGNPTPVGPTLAPMDPVTGPAGLGVDNEHNLYIVEPAQHRVIRVDGCDGHAEPLPYLRGPGSEPRQLKVPRGLLIGRHDTLYIADSGNHRIQVIDLRSGQVRAIWGQPDPLATPQPGAEPGRLNDPWALAADRAGDIYVVDHGNGRVQKFTPGGQVIAQFGATLAAQPVVPGEPVSISTLLLGEEERLLVVDGAAGKLLVYDRDGVFDAAATERWQTVAMQTTTPLHALADAQFLYVADATGRILTFDQSGLFLGFAALDEATIAALAFDGQGRLLVHPGGGSPVQQLTPGAAYRTCGTFLAGPFTTNRPTTDWQRLTATVPDLPAGAHIQLFTYTSQTLDGSTAALTPASPVACTNVTIDWVATQRATQTSLDSWRPATTDMVDFLVQNETGPYLWLAGLIEGDGTSSPRLEQIRLAYNEESWLRYLPAVYRRNEAQPTFLENALRLFESLLDDAEDQIDSLPQLFDPYAAPDVGAPDNWLDWLAGWLAFDLDERWPQATRRNALASAFALYGQRGTVESLRGLIKLYTDATAYISEPARLVSLWSLGETSTLGFDTMLAPAHADGAIIGSTATLGQSHLIPADAYGTPVFEDVAHRFCVQVYAADLPDVASLTQVAAVIEREKPAHTDYHLCLIEAKLRVGFQARLGIDTIVGGAPPDLTLDSTTALGVATVLPAATDHGDAVIGRNARLGTHRLLL